MLMNSKRVVHHHLDLTRERHQGALQARKQHLRAATLGGLVRWAAPKQIDAVVSGANEEAELACCKAELASRRASAAVRAAHDAAMSRRRAAAARIKPSLPHVDAERHLWDSALVHSEASERQSDAQAAHGPRQGSAAGDVGGSGAQAPVHITEHERRLDEALATDPPNLPVACSACGAVIDCLFRAGKLEAVLPCARRLLQVGERACVLRAQARAHEAIGHVRYSRGEFDAAKREHTVAFELARKAEHVVGRVEGTREQKRAMQAVATANIGNCFLRMGLHQDATGAYRRALALAKQAGNDGADLERAVHTGMRLAAAARGQNSGEPFPNLQTLQLVTSLPASATAQDAGQTVCFPLPGVGATATTSTSHAPFAAASTGSSWQNA